MNQNKADQLQAKVYGVAMVAAPLLLASSSAAYLVGKGQRLDRLGGTIQVYALFTFVFVILGLTTLLWQRTPRLAVAVRVIGILACVGGINYGMASVFGGVAAQLGASDPFLADWVAVTDTGMPLVLNLPGLVFPLTILILGITLWRTGSVPSWVGIMLAVAGVMFPISRISNIAPLFFVADGLFLISLGLIGLRYLSASDNEMTTSVQAA